MTERGEFIPKKKDEPGMYIPGSSFFFGEYSL
jgi:hypothetical protein